jgi:hypothetical protein
MAGRRKRERCRSFEQRKYGMKRRNRRENSRGS